MKRVTYVNLILGAWLIVAWVVFGTFATNTIAAANDLALGVLLMATSVGDVGASRSRTCSWRPRGGLWPSGPRSSL